MSVWKRKLARSLVLNSCFTSLTRPILAANSLMRSRPPSEERSPPFQLILIGLLLSREIGVTIAIEGLPFKVFCGLGTTIIPRIESFFHSLIIILLQDYPLDRDIFTEILELMVDTACRPLFQRSLPFVEPNDGWHGCPLTLPFSFR